jgi:hypothetical protein
MFPVSQEYRDAFANSRRRVARARVFDGAAELPLALKVLGGRVNVEDTEVRRRVSVELADPDGSVAPADLTAVLAPNGNELRVERGIVLPSGPYLLPVGVFGIESVEISDEGGPLALSIVGLDRAASIQRAGFTAPYTIAAGVRYDAAIQALVASRRAGLTFSLSPISRTVPADITYDVGDDPWEAARELARENGHTLYFDAAGTCVLRPEPNPLADPVSWTYAEGEQATITSVGKMLTRDGVHNGVIVTGEPPGLAPVRAEAWDDDQSSPTWRGGKFGSVPMYHSSSLITTTGQAQEVADAMLRALLGAVEEVSFGGLANAAHEPGDVVRLARARAWVDANYVLDGFDLPLGRGTMSATTRKRKV